MPRSHGAWPDRWQEKANNNGLDMAGGKNEGKVPAENSNLQGNQAWYPVNKPWFLPGVYLEKVEAPAVAGRLADNIYNNAFDATGGKTERRALSESGNLQGNRGWDPVLEPVEAMGGLLPILEPVDFVVGKVSGGKGEELTTGGENERRALSESDLNGGWGPVLGGFIASGGEKEDFSKAEKIASKKAYGSCCW